MKNNTIIFLEHIMDSILLIEKYTEGISKGEFFKSGALQDAVIRRLEIIGEAVKNLPASFRSKYLEIPWKKMAGMRDILSHQYFEVDLELVWQVVEHELSPIRKHLGKLLEKEDKSKGD